MSNEDRISIYTKSWALNTMVTKLERYIRYFEKIHFSAFYRWKSQPKKNIVGGTFFRPNDLNLSRTFLKMITSNVEQPKTAILSVFPKKWNNLLHYNILPEFRNQGYAIESIKAYLEVAKSLKLGKAYACIDPKNIKSLSLIEKLNFTLENGNLTLSRVQCDFQTVKCYSILV